MSGADDIQTALAGAKTCLATAGTLLIKHRPEAASAQAMITALRDNITDMIRDVDTIREMAKQKSP